ncbi:MAG: EamA family transporter [Chitinophagaceae bacterium]|nr:EamA family transporter [Chitinophagaceae bacterium]
MPESADAQISTPKVVAAFAVIFIVWGSTYFFIQLAIRDMPVTVMGSFRFLTAGLLMTGWGFFRKEKIFVRKDVLSAMFTGFLLLFIGNGAVAWSEQFLESSVVAVFLASTPIWFVLLDYNKWRANFTNASIITGLIVGFTGIIFLFKERVSGTWSGADHKWEIFSIGILVIGSVAWVAGSLYTQYITTTLSGSLNSGWQMLGGGLAFAVVGGVRGDWNSVNWQEISASAWWSVLYLITMGSLLGYSAYVWLLKVRPATQVSTHAYVNPVVAVLLGVYFAAEKITVLQLTGLGIILAGVLLINFSKYRLKS